MNRFFKHSVKNVVLVVVVVVVVMRIHAKLDYLFFALNFWRMQSLLYKENFDTNSYTQLQLV